MATLAPPREKVEPPAFHPYVAPSETPAELTGRALVLGAILGVIFAASSVYLALKIGLTVSASIPIAVLAVAVFRTLGRSTILENNIVQTTGSAADSIAAGIVFTLPAILLMGYDLSVAKVGIIALAGGVLGVLMMIPLRKALIVKEHGKLTYPEGTACAEVLVAGEKGGLQARLLFQAFGLAFAYKFLMQSVKLWKEYPTYPRDPSAALYKGGSISAEVSPELMGVGFIIGPRIAGFLFSGGCLAYLVLIPAIKLFGGGLTKPIYPAASQLIADMSPGEVRANYVFYIGAGAVASAGIMALIRSLPTIVSAFRSGFQDLKRLRRCRHLAPPHRARSPDSGHGSRRDRTGAGARRAAQGSGRRQPAGRPPDRGLRVLLRHRVLADHGRNRVERQSDLGHDHRRLDRHLRGLPADRLDRDRPSGRGDFDRGRHRGRHCQRGQHQSGPQDRIPGRLHTPQPADRHDGGHGGLRRGDRLDPYPAQLHLHQHRPRVSPGRRARSLGHQRRRTGP